MTKQSQARTPSDVAAWLAGEPSLAELRAAFPDEWRQVRTQVGGLLEKGDPEELTAELKRLAAPLAPSPGRMKPQKTLVSEAVRRRMLTESVRQTLIRAQTGTTDGTLRFGRVNGTVLQRLLFERGLRRKAASYHLFRAAWPLLRERERLMPLVTEQGIWCFYSKPLIRGLARIVGGRSCLEIAAGDGSLSRLLTDRGVAVTATDDFSWTVNDGGGAVESMDARAALKAYEPEVVICSWPPPGNTFERHVFSTPSVQTYILITSRLRSAAGDWPTYERQAGFDVRRDDRLARYVLPPTAGAEVYVFTRRPAARPPAG